MRRYPSQRQLFALKAFHEAAGEPAAKTLRAHPVGLDRNWPRKWAYCLEGLQGQELDAELEHCPQHLRDWVRFYVLEYFPQAKQRGIDADIAQLNERLAQSRGTNHG